MKAVMTMMTMTLKLSSFLAILTVACALTGCTAEASDPTEAADEISTVRHDAREPGLQSDSEKEEPKRRNDLPMLVRPAGAPPVPGGRATSPAPPTPPDPCPSPVVVMRGE